MRVTILGAGTSVGTPVVGCGCAVCASEDPRNHRFRPAVWVQEDGFSLLIDTGTDLRHQALRFGVDRVDAVLYTHAHADHILGFDDLRIYNFRQRQRIPLYGAAQTLENIRRTFWYAFAEDARGSIPRVEMIEVDGPFQVGPLGVVPVPVLHGRESILGYRIGGFAYCTDVSAIPLESEPLLEGLEVLVLSALRHEPHPAHMTMEQALQTIERLGPRAAYLTHMTHELGYDAVERETPPHVHPAFDGLVLEL